MTPCSICPNKTPDLRRHIIQGHGTRHARVVFIGEKPGKREHYVGIPFVGDTGEEVDGQYLPLAGLERPDCYFSNMVKCFGKGGNPEIWETRACSQHHIPRELEMLKQAEVLVLLGAHACSLVPEIRLDLDHGIPRKAEVFGREYKVFPMYHPAMGLHQSSTMKEIREDFRRLKKLLRGEWDSLRPKDEYPQVKYDEWSGTWLGGNHIGVDTETDRGRLFCVTFSVEPGMGWVVWADDKKGMEEVKRYFDWHVSHGTKFDIHNALFDLPVLAQADIHIPWESVIDTMVMAYHLRLPQSLKVLAYRLCGLRMREYSDVVGPYVEAATHDYLEEAARKLEARSACKAASIYAALVGGEDDKGRLLGRPDVPLDLLPAIGTPFPPKVIKDNGRAHRDIAWFKRVGRILRDYEKEGSEVNLRDRWKNLPAEIRRECREACGPLPPDSISMVPREEIIPYACCDAEAVLRIYPKMLEMQGELQERVGEKDWDNHATRVRGGVAA